MRTDDFQPRPGARFRRQTRRPSPPGWIDAELTEIEPPQPTGWVCSTQHEAQPTAATFELTPHADGTVLTLSHDREIDPVVQRLLRGG